VHLDDGHDGDGEYADDDDDHHVIGMGCEES
jgi:hypothetical protein